MRKLIYFPIIHEPADFGSLNDKISRQSEQKYGKEIWKRHVKYVQRAWGSLEDFISQYIETNIVQYGNIRIYQDGLSVSGELGLKIVVESAKKGSRNYLILERLASKGAHLEAAESKELLLQEYAHILAIANASTPAETLKARLLYREDAQSLLEKRDAYISGMINQTLKEKENGLAFFGAAHSIADKLTGDIESKVIRKFNDRISKEITSNAKRAQCQALQNE